MEEALKAPLAKYSTIKIGGQADRLFQPHTLDELVKLVNQLNKKREPWSILGGGSNLLISSKGVEGTVVRTAFLKDIEIKEDGLIEASAGARLPHLAKFAAQSGLSGLEFAVGIPGTVGGAVVMNAGAHGSCIANVFESALVYDCKLDNLISMSNEELGFVYRNCKLDPGSQVIVSAKFRLKPGTAKEIEAKTQANEDYRWKTQPIGIPNLGSTFKNPNPDKTAGYLLEHSGAKSLQCGKAAVSDLHANFVVNTGGATSYQVTTLLKMMQNAVYDKYKIDLNPEWKRLGNYSEDELIVWNKKTIDFST